MEEYETEFVEFYGWYRCRRCGVNEHFVPKECPVCGRAVINYEAYRTQRLKQQMYDRRQSEE